MSTSRITITTPSYISEKDIDRVLQARTMLSDIIEHLTLKDDEGKSNNVFVPKGYTGGPSWHYDSPSAWNSYITFSNSSYFPYNNAATNSSIYLDRGTNGGFLEYIELNNVYGEFTGYHFGVILNMFTTGSKCDLIVTPGVIEGRPSTVNDAPDVSNVKFYIPGPLHNIFGSNNSTRHMNSFRIYSYSGTNISFISVGRFDRCMIFARTHKLEDPYTPYVGVITSTYNGITDADVNLVEANTIDVFTDGCRIPTTFTSDIYDNGTFNMTKMILHKFVHNGYVFDNVYTYSGSIPSNHFFYNGDEYIKIAYNMLLKVD
jgi:hypothetical protein